MKPSRLLVLAIMLLTYAALEARAQNPRSTPNINDPVMIFPGDKVTSANKRAAWNDGFNTAPNNLFNPMPR